MQQVSSSDRSASPCPPGGRTDSQGKGICKHQRRQLLARASGNKSCQMNLIAFLIKLQSWWCSSRCSLSWVESDASWSGILNGLVWVGAALPQGLRVRKGQALEPDL